MNIYIKPVKLNENEKKSVISFYEEYWKINLEACLTVNDGIKNIIKYINKDSKSNKNIETKSIYSIIDEAGISIDNDFKKYLNDNTNISVNKLNSLMLYLEQLYFELIMMQKKEYNEKLSEETKKKFEEIYKNNKPQILEKDDISLRIIRFILIVVMNKKNDKNKIIKETYNLLNYISNHLLWDKEIYDDKRFATENDYYKKLNIKISNEYDFYSWFL